MYAQPSLHHLLLPLMGALLSLLLPVSSVAQGQAASGEPWALSGHWQVNESLSDNTDKRVEAALKAAGQKVQRRGLFNRQKDRYRGGPADHEMYDRMSYDHPLHIRQEGEHYQFVYEDAYVREVFTDNRQRSISLSDLNAMTDFSLGHWENQRFVVEGHARDGGFTRETYSLTEEGRLRAELYIHPKSFRFPIEMKRVYDRQP